MPRERFARRFQDLLEAGALGLDASLKSALTEREFLRDVFHRDEPARDSRPRCLPQPARAGHPAAQDLSVRAPAPTVRSRRASRDDARVTIGIAGVGPISDSSALVGNRLPLSAANAHECRAPGQDLMPAAISVRFLDRIRVRRVMLSRFTSSLPPASSAAAYATFALGVVPRARA